VLTLPDGSRVTDAVSAAGGVTTKAATGSLNLARRLIDGEQIVVGGPAQTGAGLSPQPSGTVDPTALIDLNSATVEQLDVLPGLGEVLARRIVDYRNTHGGFRSVEQLQDVSGIGASKYADIKDKVRV
jgi:competence protein ComEA